MDISIAEETLGSYRTYVAERDSVADYDQGRQDGQREYPPSHQTSFSAHELGRISEARAALNKYTRRLRESFDQVEERITARNIERDTEYNSRKAALVDQKNGAQNELKQIEGPAAETWREYERRQIDAKRAYQEQEFRVGRPPRVSFADALFNSDHPALAWTSTYATVLTFLALLEMPINEVGVRVAFEFEPPTSYVVALFIGVTFVLFAHFLGIQLVRAVYPKTRHRILHVVAALVIAAFGLAMILILYQMRGQVADLGLSAVSTASFEGTKPPAPEGNGLIAAMLDMIPWRGTLPAGSPKYAQFGLLLLNIMVFISGTVMSIYRHDPDPDLERAWMHKLRVDRTFRRLRQNYARKQSTLEREYNDKVVVTQRHADMVEAEIARLDAEKARLMQQANNDMRIVLDVLTQQITAYQKGNLETRKSRAPAYFGHAGLMTLGNNLVIQ